MFLSVEDFVENADWKFFSINNVFYSLSIDFVKEFKDRFSWWDICMVFSLPDFFIREFQNELDWNALSTYQKLPENIINEFHDKINWEIASMNQNLTEDLIVKFRDNLRWDYIIKFQRITEDLIYRLYLVLDTNTFETFFISNGKITKKRLKKLEIKNSVKRFDLLDFSNFI